MQPLVLLPLALAFSPVSHICHIQRGPRRLGPGTSPFLRGSTGASVTMEQPDEDDLRGQVEANIWAGVPGLSSPLHYDAAHNVYAQVLHHFVVWYCYALVCT